MDEDPVCVLLHFRQVIYDDRAGIQYARYPSDGRFKIRQSINNPDACFLLSKMSEKSVLTTWPRFLHKMEYFAPRLTWSKQGYKQIPS